MGKDEAMLGAAVIILIVVVILPVTFLIIGGVLSAVMGWALKDNAEATHPDSELTDLNY